MSLSTLAGDHIRLGYGSSAEQSVDVSQIWGFRLAMGSRGLQDDVPQTDRLLVLDRIVGLEAGFDGCKMVSLALYVRSPPRRELPIESRFRDAAVWYPAVPPPNLCLNGREFPQLDAYMVGYNPLFWCHFGGPGGKYLRHLTGVSVASSHGLLRIMFSYNRDVPWEYRALGRLGIIQEHDHLFDFSIDGAQGERIERIRIGYSAPDSREANPLLAGKDIMIWCEFYTNRGRSCSVFRCGEETSVCREVRATPGKVITGLYAAQCAEEVLILAMGVITEEVVEGDG
ncbi:hypothetical protein VTH06DRAFT_6265 [Thermothelomyces fergusii]